MARRTCRMWIVLVAGLAAAGCSGSNQFFNAFPSAANLASRDTAAAKSKSRAPSEATSSGSLAIARLAERRGQTEQAEHLYKGFLDKDYDNASIHHRLGVMMARESRFEEANEHFGNALVLDPDNTEILSDLGYCYYLQQRLDEAEAVLNKALKLKPNDPSVCNNLALLYGEQRRYAQCLRMFKRTCNDAEAYANLAFVYTQHGEMEKAKETYSRALTLDKKLRPAAEAMIQLVRTEELWREMAEFDPPPGEHDASLAHAAVTVQTTSEPASRDSQIGQASFQAEDPSQGLVEISDLIQP
jgi:Flp pilus assembly protein TadD